MKNGVPSGPASVFVMRDNEEEEEGNTNDEVTSEEAAKIFGQGQYSAPEEDTMEYTLKDFIGRPYHFQKTNKEQVLTPSLVSNEEDNHVQEEGSSSPPSSPPSSSLFDRRKGASVISLGDASYEIFPPSEPKNSHQSLFDNHLNKKSPKPHPIKINFNHKKKIIKKLTNYPNAYYIDKDLIPKSSLKLLSQMPIQNLKNKHFLRKI